MTALYSVAEIREIEHAALAALPPGTLMQRAGQSAAKAALELLSDAQIDARVLVLAGPGNNGGDALETVYHLAQVGLQISVLLYADLTKQSPDSQHALRRAQSTTAHFMDPALPSAIAATPWSLVIDGLFGIGLARPIAGDLRIAIENANALDCPILALDIPSGLDADTGNIVGEHGIAVRASHTITFIGDKPGLHTCYGRDYAGQVQVTSLDIDDSYFKTPHAHLNNVKLFADSLRRRPHNSHKGSYGDVIVIGGAHGMGGAPILAARAAAKCGSGRVFSAFVSNAPAYDSVQPELMCRLAQDMDFASATLVVGSGLGTSREAHDLLSKALHAYTPLVLDADALNLIAAEPGLQQNLVQHRGSAIVTPHPLEAARLLATTSGTIQADRPAAARKLAKRLNVIVVLKGSGTVIARPEGEIVINPTGNPALASAGTGDVLAGICGALLAQNFSVWNAALAAVWLHGRAADVLVEEGIGPIGVTAGELIPVVRNELNECVNQHQHAR